MKYSVVIPTYNHCDDLLKPCLESIFNYSNIEDVELIISANGCHDNTFEYLKILKEHYHSMGLDANLKIVWHDEPLGYSKACNVGIEVSTCDFIVLLNNDVIFLPQEKNYWLDTLSKQFSINDNCGITCVHKLFSEYANHEFAVFYLVMIHKKVFEKIGLLNTDYGVGFGEDIEFSIETEKAGFEICLVGDIQYDPNIQMYCGSFPVYHKGEGTVHDTSLITNWNEIFLENSLKLAKKYNPKFYDLKINERNDNMNVITLEDNKPLKLHLACGHDYQEGYINVDLYSDGKCDARFDVREIPYEDNTVDEIRAFHIIEHFSFKEVHEVLKEWHRVLKPGGRLWLETPNMLELCKSFVDGVAGMNIEEWRNYLYCHFFAHADPGPGGTHKFLFTENQLRTNLYWAGFNNMKVLPPTSNYVIPGTESLFLNVESFK